MGKLNTIYLNVCRLFTGPLKRVSRYVPDNEVPDTHVIMVGAGNEEFAAADGYFYVKTE